MEGNLTFATLIPFSLSLSILLLSFNLLTISYNRPTVTSYKLVSLMLVSLLVPKVVTAVNSVVTSTFGGIILTYHFYHNYSSECVTEPCRKYHGGFC